MTQNNLVLAVPFADQHIVTSLINSLTPHGGWYVRVGVLTSTITITSEFLIELVSEALGQYVLRT